MKYAIAIALALIAASAAQARLTPFDGTRQAKEADVVSLYTGPVAAELERNYFTAPQAAGPAGAIVQRPGRCTVSTFVFAKVTLAQACY